MFLKSSEQQRMHPTNTLNDLFLRDAQLYSCLDCVYIHLVWLRVCVCVRMSGVHHTDARIWMELPVINLRLAARSFFIRTVAIIFILF